MEFNYHTHTYLCHHASGEMREYIENSIQNGIKRMGFSDHIPFIFPGNIQSHFRVSFDDAEKYISDLRKLREEYKNDIEIFIGFEMEYYPLYFEQMLANAKKWGAEYLLLGQHYVNNEYPTKIYISKLDTKEGLDEYVRCCVTAMKTGVFTYVAHPDIITYGGERDYYLEKMSEICDASLETGVPLEINCLGIRDNRKYPKDYFWELVGKKGCKVTAGFDSHSPEATYDAPSLETVDEYIKKYGLNFVEPEIRRI